MTRNTLPYYAWYPGDFRRDTQHLTRDERAAYRDLLDEIFITNQPGGWLPDDDIHLARVVQRTQEEWMTMRYALIDGPRPMLKKRGARIYSSRLLREIQTAKEKSAKNTANAHKRWDSDRSALALPPDGGGNASKSKSKKGSTNPKTESPNNVVLKQGPVDQSRIDYLRGVVGDLAPNCRLTDVNLRALIFTFGETRVAAAVAEKHSYLTDGTGVAYLAAVVANRETVGTDADYVEYMLQHAKTRGHCCAMHAQMIATEAHA